jgi:drug/metabolite transporter (DMT)-like permease
MFARFSQAHDWSSARTRGVSAALLSAVVLGLAPIFGKLALNAGAPVLTVVMLRTVIATAALWLGYLLFWRRYIYIYPVGLAGCMLAGLINGLGSLMYYTGLSRLDASLAHLLYSIYPLVLTLLARLDGYPISRFTAFRLGLALLAIFLLTQNGSAQGELTGALLMLASGTFYAAHVAVNQRVLYDVPPPTVTVYTLSAMSLTVLTAWLLGGRAAMPPSPAAWNGVLLLTSVTLISRLALFTGVKHLGGVQTALLGLSELVVTILASLALLGEQRTPVQWLGAGLLVAAMLLVMREKSLGVLPKPKPWFEVLTTPFPPQVADRLDPPPGRSNAPGKPVAPPAARDASPEAPRPLEEQPPA